MILLYPLPGSPRLLFRRSYRRRLRKATDAFSRANASMVCPISELPASSSPPAVDHISALRPSMREKRCGMG